MNIHTHEGIIYISRRYTQQGQHFNLHSYRHIAVNIVKRKYVRLHSHGNRIQSKLSSVIIVLFSLTQPTA